MNAKKRSETSPRQWRASSRATRSALSSSIDFFP